MCFGQFAIYFSISYSDLDTKLSRHNSNVVEIKALHKSRFRYGDKYLFCLHMNLSLLFILFITFKAQAYPDKLSSNSQPKHVAFEYCLILTSHKPVTYIGEVLSEFFIYSL